MRLLRWLVRGLGRLWFYLNGWEQSPSLAYDDLQLMRASTRT